jgi:iron complex outermembrane receptor protein
MTDNSDLANWLDYSYNNYHIPTDFEYVGLKSDLGRGWYLDVKPYTLDYDNAELFTNASPIVDSTTSGVTGAGTKANPWQYQGQSTYLGVAIAPCDIMAASNNQLPCGVDKYNSYRKYGETSTVTQTSNLGVFRAGMWYEWARTDRHQYPSDPVNHAWKDQALPLFAEQFWTNTYQPFAEFEFHVTPKLNVTPGVKYSLVNFDILHHADISKVGMLGCTNPAASCSNTVSDNATYKAWLPSFDMNYRFMPNLSAYFQFGKGTIVPPSSYYDYNHTPGTAGYIAGIEAQAPQQGSSTYQTGMVYKQDRFTLDADVFRIRYQSGFSVETDIATSEEVYYLQPASIVQGLEMESTMVLAKGLNLYINATGSNAYYQGKLNANTSSTAASNPVYVTAPSGLWVAQTPSDTEMQGLTYQKYGLDLGYFNKRVGEQRVDAGGYHNQFIVNPFTTDNAFINYTIRKRNIFDGTKIRLSANNMLDDHSLTAISLKGKPTTQTISGSVCGTSACTDPFTPSANALINGGDTPTFMAGRSLSISVTFGLAPRERK